MPDDGQVAFPALAALAAAELELRPYLVERPAALGRDRAAGDVDALLDAAPAAAFPVPDPELRRVGHDIGQVEPPPVTDGREADVEAPVPVDARPETALEVDTEPDLEGIP